MKAIKLPTLAITLVALSALGLAARCERSPGLDRDAAPDTSVSQDPCLERCTDPEKCVIWFDGDCSNVHATCATVPATCLPNECAPGCEEQICGLQGGGHCAACNAPGCYEPWENTTQGILCYCY
jgi:hypothetical protein